MNQDEIFDFLKIYTPSQKQLLASTFYDYLRALRCMRYDLSDCTLEVHEKGLTIICYRPHYTPSESLTWSEIKRLLERKIYSPQNTINQLGLTDLF